MKLQYPLLAIILTGSILTATSNAQEEIPTGSLTIGTGVDAVSEGTVPVLKWTINHPQAPIDTETLEVTNRTNMAVQVLGTSIVVRRQKRFTNTEMKFTGESDWTHVFQGYDTDVDVSKVVLTRDLEAGDKIEFRTQRESSTGGVDDWRFFTPEDENNHHVNVFRDGDPLPWTNLAATSQRTIDDFLAAYLNQEETHVLLDNNQIIIAVEMGRSAPGDRGFDMQDAIFLLTFTEIKE